MKANKTVKAYLAEIGRKGGKISRREAPPQCQCGRFLKDGKLCKRCKKKIAKSVKRVVKDYGKTLEKLAE
jgi:5-methylcytosine-specific restriction endonuclease McrA